MDADEYLDKNLGDNVKKAISECAEDVNGIYVRKRIDFMGAFQGQGGSGMVRLSQSPWRGSVAFVRRQVEGLFPCAERIVSVLANVGGYLPQGKVVFLHYKTKGMCGM